MRPTNSRTIAAGGVLVTAVLTGFLVLPASRQLGTIEGVWLATAILAVPIFVVLTLTGVRYYGVARSCVVAAFVAIVTGLVTIVVYAFTFATALSGTVAGVVSAIVLFGVPALTVAILGLLALRMLGGRHPTEHQHAR